MSRFIKDILISMLASSGLLVVSTGLVNSIDSFAAVIFVPLLIIPMLAIVFGGPALVALVGGVKGRPGYILGPLLLFVLAPVLAFIDISINAAVARKDDFMRISAPLDPATGIVLEIDERFCREDCLAVIAQRDGPTTNAWGAYREHTEIRYREIETYAKMVGQECELIVGKVSQSTYESIASFLSMGITDTCWKVQTAERLPDGFVIRASDPRRSGSVALGALHGEAFELIERRNGMETVLGRRLAGQVSTHVPTVLLVPAAMMGMKFEAPRIGSSSTKADFYREVLNVDLSEPTVQGDQLVIALSKLLELMEHSGNYRYDSKAVMAFQELVHKSDCRNLGTIFPQIRRLLLTPDYEAYFSAKGMLTLCYKGEVTREGAEFDALLASSDPDDITLGLARIGNTFQSHKALQVHRQLVLDALEGNDSERTIATIIGLTYGEAAFAQPSLQSLAFGTFLRREGAPILYPLLDAIDKPLDEAAMGRAQAVFMDANGFTIEQRVIAFAMIARVKGQSEAFDLLTQLKGQTLSEMVIEIDKVGWRSILKGPSATWQQHEREVLESRKGEVPAVHMKAFSKITR